MEKQQKFVVIDGHAIAHRAYHAIRPLTSPDGRPVQAVYGFFSMLFTILEVERPQWIAVCFDNAAPTFRHKENSEYKAKRVSPPPDLYEQIEHIKRLTDAFLTVYDVEGYEADDLIGALTAQITKEERLAWVVSSDMDLLQLVNGVVVVANLHKGYREATRFDKEQVHAKYGIYPEQVVDYKALVGDTSDNLKGVPGIGPKTAVGLLERYQTLDGIYDHLEEVAGAAGDKLREYKQNAYDCQRWATIMQEAPVQVDWEATDVERLGYDQLRGEFEELAFTSLMRRMQRLQKQEIEEAKLEQPSLF